MTRCALITPGLAPSAGTGVACVYGAPTGRTDGIASDAPRMPAAALDPRSGTDHRPGPVRPVAAPWRVSCGPLRPGPVPAASPGTPGPVPAPDLSDQALLRVLRDRRSERL